MAIKLKYVAQAVMDDYYQNYKTPVDFFSLDDFVYRCGAAATDFYNRLFQQEYARMRSEGETGDVVAFSNDFLSDQVLEVKTKDGEAYADLEKDIMSFVYDASNVGVQNVFRIEPRPQVEIERSDVDELWQLQYLPITCRLFFALDGRTIRILNKDRNNAKKIRVIYVPSINGTDGEVELPDGIVEPVSRMVIDNMRKNAGKVVKESLDGNANTTLQSEMNPKIK